MRIYLRAHSSCSLTMECGSNWEKVRKLADQVAWWRVLEPLVRKEWEKESKFSGADMTDTLLAASFYCLCIGPSISPGAFITEGVHSIIASTVSGATRRVETEILSPSFKLPVGNGPQ